MGTKNLSALVGDSISFLEEVYEEYKKNPTKNSEWGLLFRSLENGGIQAIEELSIDKDGISLLHQMGVQNLLNTYRRTGHMAADIDPLGLVDRHRDLIDFKLNNLTDEDLESKYQTDIPKIGTAKLKDVIDVLERTYCSTIGSEHYYLLNDIERKWIQNSMETSVQSEDISKKERLRLFEKLFRAEYFEKFLARKYVGKKRFSVEGAETTIPMIDTLIEEGAKLGIDHFVMGMAHRGRLSVLVNTLQKPASQVFAEFEEKADTDSFSNSDVKYHMGYSNKVKTSDGTIVNLSLMFNPSHLEAVNPVALGSVRARQTNSLDSERKKNMGILIHGDAAFPGQGVVAETLNLMNLEGFDTGGAIHIVINNQIGFTTRPKDSRSTPYATDLAKGFQIPIFHVNGDDPEAAHRVMKLAVQYRQKFHKDVIIDLICYRKLGHNETDEPAFTQPMMYEIIRKHPSTVSIYEKKLQEVGIDKNEIKKIKKDVQDALESSFQETHENDVKIKIETMGGVWSNFATEKLDSEPATKLLKEQMIRVADALFTVPKGFTPHPKLAKLIESRKEMFAGKQPIDWGMAEALAFGSILESGHRIRLCGQDSKRGTFSHRHAELVDVKTDKTWRPLSHISENQGEFEVINSSLSEFSVLGFEYGYSLSAPKDLVIWEAQFGDFANGAQVIIDQFLSSSEVKWRRMSGLVLLLPHGYEGQGPEHSSARVERFLQLCAKDNMLVCNCTTPAQYFHLLRRQILRRFRKPLIIMTPKSLLRHPNAVSTTQDLSEGVFFEVLYDKDADSKKVTRILFCSGKVYYDLANGRDERKADHVAIVRMEQLYPFDYKQVQYVISSYPFLKEIVWVQEEPRNMGPWFFARDRFDKIFNQYQKVPLFVVARPTSPSPAAGLAKVHSAEQKDIVERAFSEDTSIFT